MIANEPCHECGKMMDIEFMFGLCSQECVDSHLKHRADTLEAIKKYYPRIHEIMQIINKMNER
jgi:hypothetical protein